jgi:hypothetical protein
MHIHARMRNGEIAAVLSIELVQRTQQMYNLTVDVAHTFFVGDEQWLVHNTNCGNGKTVYLGVKDIQYKIWDKQGYTDHWDGINRASDSEFPLYLDEAIRRASYVEFDLYRMDMSPIYQAFKDRRTVNKPSHISSHTGSGGVGYAKFELYKILAVRDYFFKFTFTRKGRKLTPQELSSFLKDLSANDWLAP